MKTVNCAVSSKLNGHINAWNNHLPYAARAGACTFYPYAKSKLACVLST